MVKGYKKQLSVLFGLFVGYALALAMGKVDLTLIRLAVYEIRYEESVPVKVAINEAVELAKKYGNDGTPAFVNGVLAKFA